MELWVRPGRYLAILVHLHVFYRPHVIQEKRKRKRTKTRQAVGEGRAACNGGNRTCCQAWPAPAKWHGFPLLSTAHDGSVGPAGFCISLCTAFRFGPSSEPRLQTNSWCRTGSPAEPAADPPGKTFKSNSACATAARRGTPTSAVIRYSTTRSCELASLQFARRTRATSAQPCKQLIESV